MDRSFSEHGRDGQVRPFLPGLEELCAMDAVKGPDGVWIISTPSLGGINREGSLWTPRNSSRA